MALAIDATSSGSAAAVSSITISHTCTGSNLLLYASCNVTRSANTDTITATYNGVSMTAVVSHDHSLADVLSVRIFRLIAPATGANNIVVSTTGAMNVTAGGISFSGGHQTTPEGTAVSADGVASPATVNASSATGEFVIDSVLWNGNAAQTVGAGQTAFLDASDGAGTPRRGGASSEAGAATVTMSWTSTNTVWNIGAIPVKPAASGTQTDLSFSLTETSSSITLKSGQFNPTVTEIGIVGKTASFAKSLAVTETSSTADMLQTQKTFSMTETSTVTFSSLKAFGQFFLIAATSVVSMLKSAVFNPSVTSIGSVGKTQSVAKNAAVSESSTISVVVTFISGNVTAAAKFLLAGLIRGVAKIGRGN